MISKENVMDLIGSGRYHSCILTTFSFDFYFFESKVLRTLRSAGVRNINVLIDGRYYTELLEQTRDINLSLNSAYSLQPVFTKGIFHPKIWMLMGDQEGLLLVGSGNLTSSGNGNNEELWSAFHYVSGHPQNGALFGRAWEYLSGIVAGERGMLKEKSLDWVIRHASWVTGLGAYGDGMLSPTSLAYQAGLLFNRERTIWQQLLTILSGQLVSEITACSPYYDQHGQVISALAAEFPLAVIRVVVDEKGTVPAKLKPAKNISFYHWRDVNGNVTGHSEREKKRLHAKLLIFRTKTGGEYVLMGSANLTPEGMGLNTKGRMNQEASIILYSDKGGIAKEIGIFPKARLAVPLEVFKQGRKEPISEILDRSAYPVRLSSAELSHGTLELFLKGADEGQELVIGFLDAEHEPVFSSIGEVIGERVITSELPKAIFKFIQLFNPENEPISNKVLLSDTALLSKGNPNPVHKHIEQIYDQMQGGDFSRVLDLLGYAMEEETEMPVKTVNAVSSDKPVLEKKNIEALYELSSYTILQADKAAQQLLLNSSSLRILEFLKFSKPADQADLDIDAGEQLGPQADGGELIGSPGKIRPWSAIERERKKLTGYLDKVSGRLFGLLQANRKGERYLMTIQDFSRYLIALELLQDYGGKVEDFSYGGGDGVFEYLPLDYAGEGKSVKNYLIEITGQFIRLLEAGAREYESTVLANKYRELREEALVGGLALLINSNWDGPNWHYGEVMMLNTLRLLVPKELYGVDELPEEILAKLGIKLSRIAKPVLKQAVHLARFVEVLFPAHQRTMKKVVEGRYQQQGRKGDVIYKSPFAYCYVSGLSSGGFRLARPGFKWDAVHNDLIGYCGGEHCPELAIDKFFIVEV